MPPQGLNLNEYETEGSVSAPQARNFAFLGLKSVKLSIFFFHFLLTMRLARLPFGLGGGGAKEMLPPLAVWVV